MLVSRERPGSIFIFCYQCCYYVLTQIHSQITQRKNMSIVQYYPLYGYIKQSSIPLKQQFLKQLLKLKINKADFCFWHGVLGSDYPLSVRRKRRKCDTVISFPDGAEVKVSARNAGDPGSIPGSGRSPGEGNGNPLQYSCLKKSMDSLWGRKESDTTERLHFHLTIRHEVTEEIRP